MDAFKTKLFILYFLSIIVCAKCDNYDKVQSGRVDILNFKLRGVADPVSKLIKKIFVIIFWDIYQLYITRNINANS